LPDNSSECRQQGIDVYIAQLENHPPTVSRSSHSAEESTRRHGGLEYRGDPFMFVSMKIDAESMKSGADMASELLKSLSNRYRLLILCRLSDGEHSVGQLAEFLGIRDSTVSQHLALLRREKIIAGRRDGQTIWYRIESAPARAVISTLYDSFCKTDTCAE
jgi:ArsR family transcriptional regulator, virulence genes transcriptional regulator